MTRIAVVGSANADLVAEVERFPAPGETLPARSFRVLPGGKGANQAVAAARLGADVRFVGCVGLDDYGQLLRSSLTVSGVRLDFLQVTDQFPTGVALIFVDPTGQNEIVVVPGANANAKGFALRDGLAEAEVALFQFEVPIQVVAEGLRIAEGKTILNPAPAVALPDDFPWSLVDVATPNETEAEALTGVAPHDRSGCEAAALALIGRGVREVVITLGRQGCYWHDGRKGHLIPTMSVDAVDTTAAGDAFNGALAVFLARGASMIEALTLANRAGAVSATRLGAQPSMPTLEEVLA